MFDKTVALKAIQALVAELAGAERITKATLLTLSRSTLEYFQNTQDIGPINDVLKALTPVNRKVAILFYKEFTGFKYSEEQGVFTTKSKKDFDKAFAALVEFLADPMNNIWSWAARNVEVEAKEFDEARMKKQVESLLKKVNDNGIDQAKLLRAMLEAGLKLDTLVAIMDEVTGE